MQLNAQTTIALLGHTQVYILRAFIATSPNVQIFFYKLLYSQTIVIFVKSKIIINTLKCSMKYMNQTLKTYTVNVLSSFKQLYPKNVTNNPYIDCDKEE